MGFAPQVADINGDGLTDIVSGSYRGDPPKDENGRLQYLKDKDGNMISELYAYYRKPDGSFGPRTKIAEARMHAKATLVDWDGDGDLDFIVAPKIKEIHLLENIGSSTEPEFAPPRNLLEGIEVPNYITGAKAADWDGDGLLDLMADTILADIYFFRNIGTAGEPAFAPVEVLVKGWADNRDLLSPVYWENFSSIEVVDWDGDGQLDVLLGGHKAVNPRLKANPEDQVEYRRLRAIYKKCRAEVAELYRNARNKEFSDEDYKKLRVEAKEIEKKYADEINLFNQKYNKNLDIHGRVWVFLGVK